MLVMDRARRAERRRWRSGVEHHEYNWAHLLQGDRRHGDKRDKETGVLSAVGTFSRVYSPLTALKSQGEGVHFLFS